MGDRTVWVRAYGTQLNSDHVLGEEVSGDRKTTSYGLHAGIDVFSLAGERGDWVFGAFAQYGSVDGSTSSLAGDTDTSATGYGLGVTATWQGNTGYYIDAVAQKSQISSDMPNSVDGELASGETLGAYAISLEGGKRFEFGGGGALIPQAQLTYGTLSGSFTDLLGGDVNLGNERQVLRLGVAYEFKAPASGSDNRFYVIGNVIHDFSNAREIEVDDEIAYGNATQTWAEVGLGGSMDLSDTSSLFGEASYRTAVGGESSGTGTVSLSAGLNFRW